MGKMNGDFREGLAGGLPIGLGYLSVSFSFGIMAAGTGLSAGQALLLSMSCVTSAGQLAGLLAIGAGSGLWELALAQIVINIRYALMSLTLSQRLDRRVRMGQRLLMAFENTDEVFAVAMARGGEIGARYFYGLMVLPYIGWSLGTLLGALAGLALPELITNALGIAMYGMFIAIVLPPARGDRRVALVAALSAALSCILRYVPLFSGLSDGLAVVICALIASAVGALVFPITPADGEPSPGEGGEGA